MRSTQDNRLIAVKTPLDKDKLLLAGFGGTEGISTLFEFTLDMLSHFNNISSEKIVGGNVTFSIKLAGRGKRFFNGIVSHFHRGKAAGENGSTTIFSSYSAVIVPKLWLLKNTTNSRVFQKRSAVEIVEKILQKHDITYMKNLKSKYRKREYCVQYRETDFNFISRLMEEEGIYYFFQHEDEKHTLILADSRQIHVPCPDQESARVQKSAGRGGLDEEDKIFGLYTTEQVKSAKWATKDYNFEAPNNPLEVNVPGKRAKQEAGAQAPEIYDYPGIFCWPQEGQQLGSACMEAVDAQGTTYMGPGVCRAFASGYRFKLLEHYRDDLNNRDYLLTSVTHRASQNDYEPSASHRGQSASSYDNEFTCMPIVEQYRPPRDSEKPVINGIQTAVVVGPKGEEIHTDKYGRVKVQFHWDRLGKRNENSSCWIRVGQVWAGPSWGSLFLPRIGQEVIVEFEEGDPDRPLVTNCVYHALNVLPFNLPAEKTKSGIRSRSTIGGGGANELLFEDKKGSEEIYIHGEKDWNIVVKNDKSQYVGNDERHKVQKTIVIDAGDEIMLVCGQSKIIIKPDCVIITSPTIHLNPDK